MNANLPDPIRLTRCDPVCNMARFYILALAPTLFGEVTLVRNWGRIGARGQVMMETFPVAEDADVARGRLERIKRRRGYTEQVASLTCADGHFGVRLSSWRSEC